MKLPAGALIHSAFALLIFFPAVRAQDNDVLLRAMQDELDRARSLKIVNLDPPYYIEYRVEDASVLEVNATLGGLVNSSQTAVRIPTVRIRVGDYKFDNTNHVYSDFYSGTRYDSDRLPLENNYGALRQHLWLATDRAYKAAEEGIARKRSALKNINLPEQLPDFSKAEPVHNILPIRRTAVNEATWKNRTVRLSEIFGAYSEILASSVEFESIQSSD